MINGTVVGLQARIGIILYSLVNAEREIECVIDTDFEGFLTLPSTVVVDLQLPYIAPINANLADNSRIVTNVHNYNSAIQNDTTGTAKTSASTIN